MTRTFSRYKPNIYGATHNKIMRCRKRTEQRVYCCHSFCLDFSDRLIHKKSRGATTIDPNASFSVCLLPTSAKQYHLNKWREKKKQQIHTRTSFL